MFFGLFQQDEFYPGLVIQVNKLQEDIIIFSEPEFEVIQAGSPYFSKFRVRNPAAKDHSGIVRFFRTLLS